MPRSPRTPPTSITPTTATTPSAARATPPRRTASTGSSGSAAAAQPSVGAVSTNATPAEAAVARGARPKAPTTAPASVGPAPPALLQALGHPLGDRRLQVLRSIGQTGSISQAARVVGVSYKAAWQAIDTLTNLAGMPLVDKSVGGAGGGGARLTEAGQALLAAAASMAQARGQLLAHWQGVAPTAPATVTAVSAIPNLVDPEARDGRTSAGAAGAAFSTLPRNSASAAPRDAAACIPDAVVASTAPMAATVAVQRLALQTSMRNQWPCVVQQLEVAGALARVHLLAQGPAGALGTVVARITAESAELLGLAPGLAVLALCKATAVEVVGMAAARAASISVGEKKAAAAVNQWPATATRVARGSWADEVAAQWPNGLQMLGFAAPRSGLRAGRKVWLQVPESAIVLALV